jgi:hypothetical protein
LWPVSRPGPLKPDDDDDAQVPNDLGVAVGILLEKLVGQLSETKEESRKDASDRTLLTKEIRTLTEEKVSKFLSCAWEAVAQSC